MEFDTEKNNKEIPAGCYWVFRDKRKTSGIMHKYHYNTNQYEFLFLSTGIMYCYVESEIFILDARNSPAVAIMGLYENHLHAYDPSISHDIYHVIFNANYVEHFNMVTGESLLELIKPPFTYNLNAEFGNCIQQYLDRIMQNDTTQISYAQNMLTLDLFFIELFKCAKQPIPAGSSGRVNTNMLQIINYIEKHYAEKITLMTIAQKFAFSKEHLARTFKDFSGYTVNHFILQTRLRHARLLLTTPLSVNEITAMVGFSNATYFIVYFKRNFGVTPKEYALMYKKHTHTSDQKQVISTLSKHTNDDSGNPHCKQ